MTSYNRRTLLVGLLIALLVGGVVSYFASTAPEGLEKTEEDMGITGPPHAGIQVPPTVFKDYNLNLEWLGEGFWSNAVAGVTGTLLVLGILLGVGALLRPRRPLTRPSATLSPHGGEGRGEGT